jgi:hypothetical protein
LIVGEGRVSSKFIGAKLDQPGRTSNLAPRSLARRGPRG